MPTTIKDVSYFPGCSLATTARENDQSLKTLCRRMGVDLIELEDWNCCGSSSAGTLDHALALDLSARNLFLAPPDRPLLVACPNCILRLRATHLELQQNEVLRYRQEKKWGTAFPRDLRILHFFELLENKLADRSLDLNVRRLSGLNFVPYYGCMLARPNRLRHEKNYHGLMEKTLSAMGAHAVRWPYASRCCGTFLSVARPGLVTTMVNTMMTDAVQSKADCIITACAMCHMNLEVRCTLDRPLPVFHFSEVLSLALDARNHERWFARHLVDPRPLLRARALI